MDTLLNILHVLTSVFIIGPMAILPMTGLRALRAGNGAQVDAMAKSTLIFTLLSLLVVIFGFGVLGTSDPKFNLSVGTPWVVISITLYVLAFILNLALVWPALRRAARRMLPADSTGPAETPVPSNSDYTLIAMGSGIVSILLVVIVILMVWKP
ncbi:MAG: DUF2269 family protein [Microbacteriaceae bacterium]